jgi:serine/threonine-protein kinase
MSSVEQLRAQQQAQGLGLRGDIAGAVRYMQNDLNEAQQYLGHNDIATANEYMDRADREIGVVEKFLGR